MTCFLKRLKNFFFYLKQYVINYLKKKSQCHFFFVFISWGPKIPLLKILTKKKIQIKTEAFYDVYVTWNNIYKRVGVNSFSVKLQQQAGGRCV